jgi:hypothetical protein
MKRTENHRDGKAEKSNTPIACSNVSIRHLPVSGNHMHIGGLLGRTHTSSLWPALIMSAHATISSSINHRVSNLYSTTTRLAKHINDFKDNTIALALGSIAQKYAVVWTPLRIPRQPSPTRSVLNSKQDYLLPWQGAVISGHPILSATIVVIHLKHTQNKS